MDAYIIGKRLKLLMQIKDIKRSYVAKKLNMSYNTITKKLNGQREFSYIEICKIKNILDLSDELSSKIFFDEDFDIKSNLLNL